MAFGANHEAVADYAIAMPDSNGSAPEDQVHVSAYWQYVWTGVLTLLAVGVYASQAGTKRRPAARRVHPDTAARLGPKGKTL